MPQIKPFEAPELGLRPSEEGVQSFAAAGRRLGGFYNQIAESTKEVGRQIGAEAASTIRMTGDTLVDEMTRHQVSHGAATFAELSSNLTDQWNATAKNADPNDPSVAAKFRETALEPALENFRGAFNTDAGQKWAEAHIESLRTHMYEKSASDMAALAKQAAGVNAHETLNKLSNMAMQDPSSLDFALKSIDTSVGGIVDSSPNIKGTVAAGLKTELSEKGREQIVKAAALGYIMKTGQVPPWATDEKYSKYINGIELKQFEQTARYYQHVAKGEERAQRVEADRQAKDGFNAEINRIEADMMPQRPGDKPQVPADVFDRLRKLAIHPGAGLEPGRLAATIRQVESVTDRVNKPEPLARVSHDMTMQLLSRIRTPGADRLVDNSPIYDAYQAGSLNNADFHFLVGEFNNLRTPEGAALERDRTNFFKSHSRLVDGMMNDAGIHSVLGTQRMYEFEMDARQQETKLRKEGKDPHAVYDPRSPEFWGRPENIARYRVSMQEGQRYERDLKAMDAESDKARQAGPTAKVGDRKQFKQGWGVWDGTKYVPEQAK